MNFPVEGFPGNGDEPLAACDNDGGMNHMDLTNVLHADGSIRSFSLKELKAEGVVAPDEVLLKVGPDSPVEDLRKLTLN